MRIDLVLNAIGTILKYFGVLLFLPVIFALFYNEIYHTMPFLIAIAISLVLGFLFTAFKNKDKAIKETKKNEALAMVFFSWVILGFICAIPYLFYGIPLIDSIFEAFSGITTTGATIITDFSLYPKTLYFYRALSQWLGGMGVIVLFIAILPKFAVAGRQMFYAESPGPVEEKITPRIRQTALRLWEVYLGLTILEIILLFFVGKVDLFNSICTSLATISSGGFTSSSDGISAFLNNKVYWIILTFMFLSGCNFVLQYKVIIQRKLDSIFKNEELLIYIGIILLSAFAITLVLLRGDSLTFIQTFKNSIFTVVSAITTTGFSCVDFNLWNIDAKIILFMVMFIGGCATSTSGGIKVIRLIYVFKYLKNEVAKIIHPNAVYPIKLNGAVIGNDVHFQFLAFFIFYMAIFVLSSFVVCLIEDNITVAVSGSITTLGNIGLAVGTSFGVADGFESLSVVTKTIFIFNMIIGRLELIPFLALLHPDAWRKN
ncbi:MAG: TrkH family potassium uptake protein [Cyanobacteria bacterium SIG30]|nr:TrkH family potassium uptake protein [Cyanobacteria bacterium SIG30]